MQKKEGHTKLIHVEVPSDSYLDPLLVWSSVVQRYHLGEYIQCLINS